MTKEKRATWWKMFYHQRAVIESVSDEDAGIGLKAAFRSFDGEDIDAADLTITGGGTGYRFNAEGNQISYRCDVRRVTTINYDRKAICAALGKLNQQADETSTRIDLCLVTSKVDYAPPFDVNASFAEAFEAYTETAGA